MAFWGFILAFWAAFLPSGPSFWPSGPLVWPSGASILAFGASILNLRRPPSTSLPSTVVRESRRSTHFLGILHPWHANSKVGIYGLALNPNRRKFGWLPAERQVGGKERCWPNSMGQPIQGCHPSTIYNQDMPPPPHPSGVKVVPS